MNDTDDAGVCQHPEYAKVYEKHGGEVMGVRCGECGVHL